MYKPPKSYLQIFNREHCKAPNMLTFTIEENNEFEELKEEGEDEMIGGRNSRKIRPLNKTSRGYSLYVKQERQEKSLQDRELERLIAKDVQSKPAIKSEIDDS